MFCRCCKKMYAKLVAAGKIHWLAYMLATAVLSAHNCTQVHKLRIQTAINLKRSKHAATIAHRQRSLYANELNYHTTKSTIVYGRAPQEIRRAAHTCAP